MVLLLVLPAGRVRAQLSVGQVKALFIERFTRFIDWPAAALAAGQTFVVCVQGTGGTADDLARVAVSRKFKDRNSAVRRLQPGDDVAGCHILYLAASESPRLERALAAVGGKPILTIGDTPGYGQRGVVINLYQEGRFMRFEINNPAVKRSRLTFSSQLMRLGKPVEESPRR